MQIDLYYTYLVPSLIGLLVVWLCCRDFCHAVVKAAIFFVAQILIVHYYSGTPYSAQLVVLSILAGYAVFAFMTEEGGTRSARIGALLFFGAYILYWALEKYFLPLGLVHAFSLYVARLAHAPVLGTKTAERVSSFMTRLPDVLSRPAFAMVGISYTGFKLIHFFVDYRAGDIKRPKLLEFLNWLFFFPSIIAGPMIRFQDWQAQRKTNALRGHEIADGAWRIVFGLFMKLVLADSIRGLTIADMTPGALSLASPWQFLLAACSYSVYLYWDFAGYSHIAIGLARFWNINLPENFNAPYRARNLAEFWTRWHITLSAILRDYLFYPISLALKRIPGLKKFPIVTTVTPPLVTFLLAGIWHGTGIGFAIFGLLHGVGLAYLAVVKRYKQRGTFARWWASSPIAYICSVLITFLYVSFTFIFFCLPADKLFIVWENMRGL